MLVFKGQSMYYFGRKADILQFSGIKIKQSYKIESTLKHCWTE